MGMGEVSDFDTRWRVTHLKMRFLKHTDRIEFVYFLYLREITLRYFIKNGFSTVVMQFYLN